MDWIYLFQWHWLSVGWPPVHQPNFAVSYQDELFPPLYYSSFLILHIFIHIIILNSNAYVSSSIPKSSIKNSLILMIKSRIAPSGKYSRIWIPNIKNTRYNKVLSLIELVISSSTFSFENIARNIITKFNAPTKFQWVNACLWIEFIPLMIPQSSGKIPIVYTNA